jgi:hypothetical protein
MTTIPFPYFFDEADRASIARQPGEREKMLRFTMDDLNWLKGVYLPTRNARETGNKPMYVDRLLLRLAGKTDIQLAGAFAMSRPNDGEVMLYTPWKGLIKFAAMGELKEKLKEWLRQDTGRIELLRFLAIEQRNALPNATEPDIAEEKIEGAVFEDQTLNIERNQAKNIKAMIGEMVKMPTLQSMLDDTLKNALLKPFPKLDQRLTRLKNFVGTVSAEHTLSSLSLSDALLHYYLHNQWPPGDSRVFSNPRHATSSDADNQTWESTTKEIAQSFTPHLHSLLETFWNTPMSNGQSRSTFFAECMCDTFHMKLLLQRQQGVLTTEEYQRLKYVSAAPAATDPLRIEKVRVRVPYKPYAELACTLMIGSSDTLGFLYTQSRGIEATTDLPAVRTIVLQMLKSEGHEDTLLNFMSLDERRTFLSMDPDERKVLGVPITGPVFEGLMADIQDKQMHNLSHALSRCRESEGTLDPHALLDNALDVRGLIDDRLLIANAGGRWSTQVDQRWNAQPATVRAESAKEQLTLLSTVEQAVEQRLENHPVIPATTSTFADAERIVASSLQSLKAAFAHTLSTALRSELKLQTVARSLGATEQAIIKTVLDTPVRLQRAALNGFLPDVFSLALKNGDSTDLLKLASCFVMTERGGLDPMHSGKAIAWTPARGYEAFPSLKPLLDEFERRLKDADACTTLLENLGRSERVPGKRYTLAPLQRIDEYFLDHLQKPFVQLDQAFITSALAAKPATSALTSLLNLTALRQPMTGLQRATDIAQSLTTQKNLPAWLAKASIKDQMLHAELLQQYLNNVTNDQDYLTGTRSLTRTAHHELTKQLQADNFEIDPDKVQIKPRMMSATSIQTLTELALTHFKDLDHALFDVASLDATEIPDGLDESYIKDLIRNLSVGEHQKTELNAAFDDTQASNAQRKKRFYAQLPWQLIHHAHTEKLQERLSETGFDLIRQIMEMPDAIAREALEGADAIIRPLELSGIRSGQTIKVPGTWLIGKKDAAGPQVLVAPCSPTHGVKEYENESLLLNELKNQGPLRDWALNSLSSSDRTLCKNRMTPTSKESAGIRLASNPIRKSLFKQLFEDNAKLLARLLGCQSNNDAQSEWATIKRVLGEDLEQAYSFVMGKLAYPITVWRSYRDIKDSAEDLQTHKWVPAIKAFISGIAQLAMLRQSMENQTTPSSTVSEPASEAPDTRLKWTEVNITSPDRARLKRYESTDTDLSSLTLNTELGLYTHPTTKQIYGPVEGNVYPVAKRGTRWRISDDKIHGPYLRQNVAKQWLLDRTPKPRFGLINRIDTAMAAWAGMNVEAEGMSKIRSIFPVKARLIDESLDLATTYAWNSLRNLQWLKVNSTRVTPVHRLIRDFIGVQTIRPEHLDQLEKIVGEIFAALLDPTLRQPKSARFAVGKVLEQSDSTFGFTVLTDRKKKIYLAEKFFLSNFDHYRNHLKDAAFPIGAHARAATLIHELSHIVCKTEDITYLDPSRPFADLIETTNLTAVQLKNALTDVQNKALSIKTPLTELFTVYDPDTDVWKDLGSTTQENTDRAKAIILRLTGQKDLSDARQKFMNDSVVRLAVQLGNADTVTWLITHLGRQLHTKTP